MAELPAWYLEFAGAVVAALPRELDEAAAQRWTASPDALAAALSEALFASPAVATAIDLSTPLVFDGGREGVELLEDVKEPEELTADNFGQSPVFGDDEPFTVGEDVVERVQGMAPKLGQRHAEFLLQRQELIPDDFRRYSLVFGGTLWRDTAGNHYAPCLTRSQGEWKLSFGILEYGMDSSDRMAVPVG